MHKPESVLENEMRKILLDFEIQANHSRPGQKTNPNFNEQEKEPVI